MVKNRKHIRLKKELGLMDVYAIATGATLSAGFFLLPGIAAVQAGPALVLAYMIAAIPLIPAMFSVIELATAMPRAGGVYYFLDRSLGPFFGTIGGIGTWLALILKVAFALVGMGAYVRLYFPEMQIKPLAVVIALILGALCLFGAHKSSKLQVWMALLLLALLGLFFGAGVLEFQPAHFENFFASGFDAILGTAGMVYISYVGVTKVASLSEEVKNPERNLPLGIMLALGTSLIVYCLGTTLIVGLVPAAELHGSLTPVATAADYALGPTGKILLSLAALLAFVSVANAGLLSSSRYPLAMSRDHLLPPRFRRLSKFGTPTNAILVTLASTILLIVLFDPMRIAKLASAFQLLMFALVCLAVIVMRESRITSYDPGYKSPFYPWMQIVGMIAPFLLIAKMGLFSMLFSGGMILVATLWFVFYARRRVERAGAIYHVFERLGRHRYQGLDPELRGILREKGLRASDPFDEIVLRSLVFDQNESCHFEGLLQVVAHKLRRVIPLSPDEIMAQIMEGTRIGATPVSRGVALPHFRTQRIDQPEMVLVRNRQGITMTLYDPLTQQKLDDVVVNAVFFLISPERDPAQHLRMLARIAERVDEDSFATEWQNAKDEHDIKESLLHDDQIFSLSILREGPSAELAGQLLRDSTIPEGCLVAILSRGGISFVPDGKTLLQVGDRLTIIGDQKGLAQLRQSYGRAEDAAREG